MTSISPSVVCLHELSLNVIILKTENRKLKTILPHRTTSG